MGIEAIAASTGAWLWENYGKDVTSKLIGDQWAKFNWKKSATAYRQKVSELYTTIKVLGNPKPVELEGIFTDVFILNKLSASRRFNIHQLKQDPGSLSSTNRHNGLRIVIQKENQRLFILGKPGAGKTTFLKYITLQAVKGKIDKVPIFVSLKEWADSNLDLFPFLIKQFEICAFPDAQRFIENLLQTGQAIVMFDGLDEVNQEKNQRNQAIATISEFTRLFRNSQCLITCRVAATDYFFDDFTYVELADFDDRQMRTFVHKWFSDDHAKRNAFLTEFSKEEHRGLRELGRTPLLLSLLCIVFDEMMTFPIRRVEVYEEALDALLKKWDASRNIKRDEIYRKLSLGFKRRMFARIAAETFTKGDYFIHQDYLAKQIADYLKKLPPVDLNEDIDGDAILKAIEAQHGILIERAYKIYSFSHLTFQEYFTAKYIADNASLEILNDIISTHLTDSRWREVLLLIASLLDNTDLFFTLFKQASDNLISSDRILVKILKWVTEKAKLVEPIINPVAARALYLELAFGTLVAHDDVRELALSFNFAQDHGLIADYISLLDLVLDRGYSLAHDLNDALELARALVDEQKYSQTFPLVRDLLVIFLIEAADELGDLADTRFIVEQSLIVYEFYNDFLKLIKFIGPNDFYKAVSELKAPSKNSKQDFWQSFASDLRQISGKYCDIGHNWVLTDRKAERMTEYVQANLLLAECLKVAYVSDRKRVENSLLSVQ
ncbi:MAG: NACHT domain-containing protein [Anaerolineae bacterium]|nr:NACHT domain-containing protein [Anaerolineae bacterium]